MSRKMNKTQKNKTIFKSILDNLDIDETLTKGKNLKQKNYNKFADSVVPEPDFNYMADLLFLPETTKKFKYLFVITDLATRKFDIEPMKNTLSLSSVTAMKAIVKRGILKLPEISIKTDGGSEFKSNFNTYLTKHKIYHSVGTAHRKTQMAPVERLNKSLGRLFMQYLNKMEEKLDEDYTNWTDIVPQVRKELNDFRERDIDKLKEYQSESFFDSDKAGKPKFEEGQFVHYRLLVPQTVRGHKVNDTKFREGDRKYSIDTKKIITILYYPDAPFYRYKLQGLPHISYTDNELMLSTVADGDEEETTYIVKKVIGSKIMKKEVYYLVWWRGYLKADATWEKGTELIKDGLIKYIDAYKKEANKKKR